MVLEAKKRAEVARLGRGREGATGLLPVWVQYRCYPYPFHGLSQGLGEGSLYQTVVSGAELRLLYSPH